MKFTFKRNKQNGRFSSFYDVEIDIKYKTKIVGNVTDKSPYQIRLMIRKEKTTDDPAPFKWIALKKSFESLEDCLNWLRDNTTAICSKYDLYEWDK